MTANATRRAVPMTGTGDGPRPDSTTFASTARTDGGRRADRRSADSRSADERRATTNRTAADDSTQ
ncbi:hypothetical protein ACOZ35_06330 [Halorubrum xinjiangense]|uniref:hypothetical protein n=1 Tax=Halorubrum xinjiangense TaxID=261291 RepID=UPI003C6F62BA